MAAREPQVKTEQAELQRPHDEELDLFGITDRGKVRPDNQDHFLVCTVHPEVVVHQTSLPNVEELPLRGSRLATMLVVADGVGGGSHGSEAARLATEAVMGYRRAWPRHSPSVSLSGPGSTSCRWATAAVTGGTVPRCGR